MDIDSDRLGEIEKQLAQILDTHSQSEEWLRISIQPLLEQALNGIFTNHKQIRAYELSDGEKSSREIAQLIGVGQKTISRWWQSWEKEAIVVQNGKRGQYQKKYSLFELITIKNNDTWVFDRLQKKETVANQNE